MTDGARHFKNYPMSSKLFFYSFIMCIPRPDGVFFFPGFARSGFATIRRLGSVRTSPQIKSFGYLGCTAMGVAVVLSDIFPDYWGVLFVTGGMFYATSLESGFVVLLHESTRTKAVGLVVGLRIQFVPKVGLSARYKTPEVRYLRPKKVYMYDTVLVL